MRVYALVGVAVVGLLVAVGGVSVADVIGAGGYSGVQEMIHNGSEFTQTGDIIQSGDVQIRNSSQVLELGTGGATGRSLVAGDTYITGASEHDGVAYFDAGSANAQGVVMSGRLELPAAGRIQWGAAGHMIGNLSATDGRFALANNAESDYIQIDAAGTTKTITTDDGDMAINAAGGDLSTTARFASTLTALSLDGATTLAVVRNVHTIACVGPETLTTLTGGASGMVLTAIFLDANCTVTDTDDGGADTIDLTGTATNQVSADDMVMSLVHDGTLWRQVAPESAN